MIYLIPLILILIGCFQYDRPQKKNKGNFLWGLTYVALVLIVGLRYKVGGDTYNYMDYFINSPEVYYWKPFDRSGFEPGFSFITSIIRTYTENIYIYQTIISACMTLMLMYFVKKNTEFKFLAMILIFISMYLYFSTEIIRESLAIGGCLLSYHFIEEKKYIKYFFVCLLLLTLHSSAVICFIFPFIKFIRFDKYFFIWVFAVIVCGAGMSKLMEYLSGNYLFHKLLRYYTHSYVGYLWCGLRFIYFSILPLCTIVLCKKRLGCHIEFESIICLQILFGFGIWFVPVVFQRLINYTIIFYLVSVAEIIGLCLRNKSYASGVSPIKLYNNRMCVKFLLIATIMAHASYYIHLNFYERYLPYHSMFDPIDEPMREKYVAGQD